MSDQAALAPGAGRGSALQISAGATGQPYAQITQGAPYDVFPAADQARAFLAFLRGPAAADVLASFGHRPAGGSP